MSPLDESVSVGVTSSGTHFVKTVGSIETTNSYSLVASTVGLVRFEETEPQFGFSSGWSTHTSDLHSGGTMKYSTTAGASVRVDFEGSQVRVLGATGPNRGIAEVFLDGESQGTVDLYGDSWRYQQVTFEVSGLADGPHVLEWVVTGEKHPASGTVHVDIDAVEAPALVQS